MTTVAMFTVLFKIEMRLVPNLVKSYRFRLKRRNKSKGTGSPLGEIFKSAVISTGKTGHLTCFYQAIMRVAVCCKCPHPKMNDSLKFQPIWLVFFLTEAVRILVFVLGPVLYDNMIAVIFNKNDYRDLWCVIFQFSVAENFATSSYVSQKIFLFLFMVKYA